MVAEARAGCRFFSGYPITPAPEIYRDDGGLQRLRRPRRADEISALRYYIGAWQRGAKV